MRMSDLKPGWAVVANDGHRLGTVKDVGQNHLLTSRMARGDLFVPASAIANVEKEVVYLNVTAAAAEEMGWARAPRSADEPTGLEDDLHRHI